VAAAAVLKQQVLVRAALVGVGMLAEDFLVPAQTAR